MQLYRKKSSIISPLILAAVPLILAVTPLQAADLSELEEITMQVVEGDSIDNLEIQQMISIPAPIRETSTKSDITFAAKPTQLPNATLLGIQQQAAPMDPMK